MIRRLAFLVGSVLVCFTSRAQFYAPETEYHDKVQRLFVVELARVLAWRENLSEPKIQEITYKVTVNNERATRWELQLLDANGKALQHIEVSYPDRLLQTGPQFYRDVFKQEWLAGKWSPLPVILNQDLTQRFWAGAARAGMSREEGLEAAFEVQNKPKVSEGEYAPALAGLLSHVPLPSLCGGVTLDAMTLSRAAAWLCLSEAMLGKSDTPGDEKWAPIIFMAGREYAASDLWKKSVPSGGNIADQPRFFRWWNFFLRQPTAKDIFLFATDPEQRSNAMPMMTYYAQTRGVELPLAEVLMPLYADDKRTISRLHNYGPFLALNTGIGGGRILEGGWPLLSRMAWLKTMRAYLPTALDYTNYLQALADISSNAPALQPDEDDLSLTGLKTMGPLLELGYQQGEGKLIPVATVTSRDLLNYGWEMNSMQMGSRYMFVHERWGVPDLAQKIFDESTRDIEGQAPFFGNDFQKSVFNLQPT
jgi:hypothetical protein